MSTVKERRRMSLMLHGIPRYVRIYDGGPDMLDRYTVVFTGVHGGFFVALSDNPMHPQGYYQHGDGTPDRVCSKTDKFLWPPSIGKRNHLGLRIAFGDLPDKCKAVVVDEYEDIWGL